MKAFQTVGVTALAVALLITLVMVPTWLGEYQVAQLPTKTLGINKDSSALDQISLIYAASGAGNIWYVTEDVYGQRVLDMNNAKTVVDILYKDEIIVPWNQGN